ncbi:hypothetical protein [Phycicoccus ginsengisoli]
MAQEKGLRHDAKRLTTKARVKRDNAAGIQADAQFSTALNRLTTQFLDLRSQLANRKALTTVGIPIGPAPDLTKSAERLRDQVAEYGRPTPQFMNSRSADLAGLVKALQVLTDEAWKAWASAQVGALTADPELVKGPRGQVVKEKIAGLSQVAGRPFNATDFTLFKLGVAQAHDLIRELSDPTRPEEVLARINEGRGSLTFADLTDEEIDALRNSTEHGRRVRLSAR